MPEALRRIRPRYLLAGVAVIAAFVLWRRGGGGGGGGQADGILAPAGGAGAMAPPALDGGFPGYADAAPEGNLQALVQRLDERVDELGGELRAVLDEAGKPIIVGPQPPGSIVFPPGYGEPIIVPEPAPAAPAPAPTEETQTAPTVPGHGGQQPPAAPGNAKAIERARPKSVPKQIPAWAWTRLKAQQGNEQAAAEWRRLQRQGKAPRKVPKWYWDWVRWRTPAKPKTPPSSSPAVPPAAQPQPSPTVRTMAAAPPPAAAIPPAERQALPPAGVQPRARVPGEFL